MAVPTWVVVIVGAFFGGLAIGYALKIMAKVFLASLGFYIIATGILYYYGVVMFNQEAAMALGEKIYMLIMGKLALLQDVVKEFIAPFVSFLIGVVTAFKKIV